MYTNAHATLFALGQILPPPLKTLTKLVYKNWAEPEKTIGQDLLSITSGGGFVVKDEAILDKK